jgi:HSP20 family protein
MVMNALTRWNPFKAPQWDPFKELDEMQNRLSGFLGRSPAKLPDSREEAMIVAEWAPLVDIAEDDKEFLVKAELPEMKKEDVKVSVEDGVLSISGERKFEKEEKNKKYHRIERSYGNFLRTFSLPEGADASKVSADFKDGVLTVHLPKNEKAKAKAIEVKVA